MTLLGVVPEPADVLDQFAVVIDEYVVDGDHTMLRVADRRVFLQHLQPLGVQQVGIPSSNCQKAVQTRLIRCVDELSVALIFPKQANT